MDFFDALVECDHALLFWDAAMDFFNVKLPRLHPVTWTRSCVFLHESRNFKFEAHNLAKFALSLGPGRHVRLGTPYNADIVPVNIYANE